MRRTIAVAAVLVLVVFAIRDPYTFRWGGGEALVRAPWWQTALGLIDIALLAALVSGLWRKTLPSALVLLLVESVFTILLTGAYLLRDGLMRFSTGFSGLGYLPFFAGGLVIRVLIVLWLVGERTRMKRGSGQ